MSNFLATPFPISIMHETDNIVKRSYTIREQIVNILKEIKPNKNLEGITNIVEGNFLDSFEIMNLIMMLSETFGVEIDFEEITAENFNSIDAMVAMVERLTK